MSKKKSYININNILTEGAIGSFLRGLFGGKPGKKIKKVKYKLEKNIKDYNNIQSEIENEIEKQYGKKVKLQRHSIDDFIDGAR